MGPPRALRTFAAFTLLVLVASIVFGFKTGARDRAQAVVYAYAHGLATSTPER